LTVAFRVSGSHNAQVYYGPQDQSGANYLGMLQQAGMENLSLLRPPGGIMDITDCAYCWLKNVEVSDWGGGGISIDNSWRVQIEGDVIDNIAFSENNGAEYPISLDGGATEVLIENSIIRLAGKGGVARMGGAGSVWAYNYIDDTMYNTWLHTIGDSWMDEGLNASHLSGPHHVLFEGNWGDNCDNDNTHGNNMYLVYFRNQCSGLRTPFFDPSYPAPCPACTGAQVSDQAGMGYSGLSGTVVPNTPGPLRAVGINAYNYWHTFVGNVLGIPGLTTAANNWVYTANYGSGSQKGAMWELYGDPNLDGRTGSFFFRHGNYDTVNNAIVDWQGGYSQSLPNSLYLSSRPSFFGPGASCTYPWPWVNSAGSPQLPTNSCGRSGLPAKARWEAGTPMLQP
jgi:hypothetical protein